MKKRLRNIRTLDREEFNSDRRFYARLNDVGEYIDGNCHAGAAYGGQYSWDMLNEIEDENSIRFCLRWTSVTLQIVLLKMQGYST